MNYALVSMAVQQGNCDENFKKMKAHIQGAKEKGIDLIVFPQNALSGYALGDLWLDEDFCSYCDQYNDQIRMLADSIAVVWGNVRYRGGRLFNTAFFAYQDQFELRVKGQCGALCNDARYFSQMDTGDLIAYKGEWIALNFHDDLQLATLNITLDASEEAVMPKGASQIYVNAGGICFDERGVHQLNGRCYATKNKQFLHFSEYVQGCFYVEEHQTSTPVYVNAHERFELLLEELEKHRGLFTLSKQDWLAQRISDRFDRPWLLQEGTNAYRASLKGETPSLLCSFTPEQLLNAHVIDDMDELSVDEILIAYYEKTHRLKAVCYHACRDFLGSRQIASLLKSGLFVERLLSCMKTYYSLKYGYQMDEQEHEKLQRVLQEFIEEKRKGFLQN